MSPSRQIRWIDLTEAEKEQILKLRSSQGSRKNRQRWKENDKEMMELYEQNEKKIEHLERLVKQLSSQLWRSCHCTTPLHFQHNSAYIYF